MHTITNLVVTSNSIGDQAFAIPIDHLEINLVPSGS